jgi:hypothetical protein
MCFGLGRPFVRTLANMVDVEKYKNYTSLAATIFFS